MPVISMFYGVVVYLYFYDNKRHHLPHVHVEYQEHTAVIEIPSGRVIEGSLPNNKLKLVTAWIEIHQEDLMADWKLATTGQAVFKIDPLK